MKAIPLILALGLAFADAQAKDGRPARPDFACNIFEAPEAAAFEDAGTTFFRLHAKLAGINVDYEFEFDGNRWEAIYQRPAGCAGIAADYFSMQALAVLSDPDCDANRMAYPMHAATGNGYDSQERDTRGLREEFVGRCKLVQK